MSKECIDNCPIINAAEKTMRRTPYYYGYGVSEDLDLLMSACRASFDCPGAGLTEVDVVKGVFKRRIETESQYVCRRFDKI